MGQKEKLNQLQEKLDGIFEGIDGYYSQAIMDELIKRIDVTISDFNKEFETIIEKLNPESAEKLAEETSTASKKK
jgi:hypothetical protein